VSRRVHISDTHCQEFKQLRPDNRINNINILFVFSYKVTEDLIVTKNDKCYGFGQNDCGVLGLGHNRLVREPKIIEELCSKQIISFANCFYHMMALMSYGRAYN
jgi:alpha-tubulin suppressor-like RCC1 family protein